MQERKREALERELEMLKGLKEPERALIQAVEEELYRVR